MEDNGIHVEPAWSVEDLFVPHPWIASEVYPLYNDDGKLLGFIANLDIPQDELRKLPTEFFNHQLKDVDIFDVDSLCELMSVYGLIGTGGRTFGESFGNTSGKVLSSELSPESTIKQLGVRLPTCYYIRKEKMGEYIADLKKAKEAALIHDGEFVSAIDVYSTIATVINASAVYKALMLSNDPDEVISIFNEKRLIGRKCEEAVRDFELDGLTIKERSFFTESYDNTIIKTGLDAFRSYEGIIANALNELNILIQPLSPKAGVYLSCDKAPSFDDVYTSGSIDEAMALQVWEFGLKGFKNGHFICQECGELFVTKQSSGKRIRNAKDRSKAFCCPNCKNKKTQRDYRNRRRSGGVING